MRYAAVLIHEEQFTANVNPPVRQALYANQLSKYPILRQISYAKV